MSATPLQDAVRAFVAADLGAWTGLPGGVRLTDLRGLIDLDEGDVRPGELGEPGENGIGEPGAGRGYVAAATDVYAGGLRVWVDDGDVVALEGIDPRDAAGEPVPAPPLGRPDLSLDTHVGPVRIPGGEQVHAAAGLAVRLNPETGLLLGLVGFTPTDAENYRTRVRPRPQPTRTLLGRRSS